MSYSVYLEIDTGGKEPAVVFGDLSVTWNLMPMFYKALGGPFKELKDCLAKDVEPILTKAIAEMTNHPEEYRLLEPDNGWGTYESGLRFLKELQQACLDNPKCTLIII